MGQSEATYELSPHWMLVGEHGFVGDVDQHCIHPRPVIVERPVIVIVEDKGGELEDESGGNYKFIFHMRD